MWPVGSLAPGQMGVETNCESLHVCVGRGTRSAWRGTQGAPPPHTGLGAGPGCVTETPASDNRCVGSRHSVAPKDLRLTGLGQARPSFLHALLCWGRCLPTFPLPGLRAQSGTLASALQGGSQLLSLFSRGRPGDHFLATAFTSQASVTGPADRQADLGVETCWTHLPGWSPSEHALGGGALLDTPSRAEPY